MAFESLSDKLQNVFKKLRGKGVLTEKDLKEALREVKMGASRSGCQLQSREGFHCPYTGTGCGAGGAEQSDAGPAGYQDRP